MAEYNMPPAVASFEHSNRKGLFPLTLPLTRAPPSPHGSFAAIK